MEYPSILRKYPPVAKLDIAVDSDSKGRGFESLRAGQKKTLSKDKVFFNEIRLAASEIASL